MFPIPSLHLKICMNQLKDMGNFEDRLQCIVMCSASSSLYLKQCPRASFWPMLMRMLPKMHCARSHIAKMFCIHSLMLISLEDYTFWEQWFPDVKASAYFHVSVQNPAALGTQSLTCCSVTIQCFRPVSLSPHVFPAFSFLSSHLLCLSLLR